MAAGPEQARSETTLPLTRHAAGEAPVGDAVVERGEVDGPGGDPDRLGTSGRAVRRMGLTAESGSSGERNGVTGFLAIGGAHAQAGAGPAVAAVPPLVVPTAERLRGAKRPFGAGAGDAGGTGGAGRGLGRTALLISGTQG